MPVHVAKASLRSLLSAFLTCKGFYFKLCELRKINSLQRRHWYHGWESYAERCRFVLDSKFPMAWPVFISQSGRPDAWSLFVEAVIDQQGSPRPTVSLSRGTSATTQVRTRKLRKTPTAKAVKRPMKSEKSPRKGCTKAAREAARAKRLETMPNRPPCPLCKQAKNVVSHLESQGRWKCMKCKSTRSGKKPAYVKVS